MEDLDRFCQIARLVDEEGSSFREIGSRLVPPMSDTGVRGVLERLARRYGVNLVASSPKEASANMLTAEGKKLYDLLRVLETPEAIQPPRQRKMLRFAVSQSLVTNQVITPGLDAFLREFGQDVQVHLELWTNPFFARVLDEIARDNIDSHGVLEFAIVWGTEQRMRLNYPEAKMALFGPEFPVVAISHSAHWIEQISGKSGTVNLTTLANAKLAVLEPTAQPSAEIIPRPNRESSGWTIEFSTIDACVACVAAQVADCAVIPDLPALIDPLVAQRRIHLSAPLGTIQLALCTRKAGRSSLSEHARKLVECIERQLALLPVSRPSPTKKDYPLPTSPEFYQKLSWGYFVETVPPEKDRSFGRPSWLWETLKAGTVRVHERGSSGRAGFSIAFVIQNLFDRQFEAMAEWDEQQFTVRAVRTDEESGQPDETTPSFTAVFNWGCEERGVIYGVWCGRDWDKKPVVYPELWSQRPLSIQEITEISRMATIYSTLHPDPGQELLQKRYLEKLKRR